MTYLITLEVDEQPRDNPGLGYELASAKHDGRLIDLVIHGFDYPVQLRRVELLTQLPEGGAG